jgi:putative SOS response-associated peptidase YedK
MGFLKWGLIPPWAKDISIGNKMINARSETITEKPSFRAPFRNKRCIIIADSFYEWKRHSDKSKTPMRIKLKNDELFAMAGIWDSWRSPQGKTIYSCAVITTDSNGLMKEIHNRMPVILQPDDEQTWLDPALYDPHYLTQLLKPFDEKLMEAYEVSPQVNSVKNNSINLIQKIC